MNRVGNKWRAHCGAVLLIIGLFISTAGAQTPTTVEYQISRGDTLGSLAEQIAGVGGSHQQRRQLIQQTNPHIFIDGDPDQLYVGAIVNLPSGDAANSVEISAAPAPESATQQSSAANTDSDRKTHQTLPEKHAEAHHTPIPMAAQARLVEHDSGVFKPDPDYADEVYDAQAQKAIYGGKRAVYTPRPLLELGRPQYQNGPLTRSYSIVGERNRVAPALSVYGDLRTALAFNENNGEENNLLAARLNLDIDLKLTGTERLHAFIRPLDKNNEFSRIGFNDRDDDEFILDGNLETLFFEGDLGAIFGGLADKPSTLDLPFAVGLMPLLFQNGVWMEDAFTGVAFSIPARNSRRLDISNFDLTFFAGFDKVSNEAIRDSTGAIADDDVHVYGFASFWELLRGYAEVDYAFIDGRDQFDAFDHHSLSVAFSKRIKNIASTSVRVVHTFGQDLDAPLETAGGTLLLWENSLITSKPSTLIPYLNLFAGFDRPRSVARDNGGLLKTVGINFESDALTGYPLLDDSGQDAWGGALGIQYLFNLDRQIVVELAAVNLLDDAVPLGSAQGDQVALGIRYQRPLGRAWLFRADAIRGWLDNAEDFDAFRFEIRRKF